MPAKDLWEPVLTKGLAFCTLEGDGEDAVAGSLQRKSAHRKDASAQAHRRPHFEADSDTITDAGLTRSGGRVDVEGGWFDEGDYLKFTHSTADADVLLHLATASSAVNPTDSRTGWLVARPSRLRSPIRRTRSTDRKAAISTMSERGRRTNRDWT
jgi:hypothetical protein